MNGRVLLLQLSERTSAKGRPYLGGWLGKASVVAFQAEEPDKFGNPVWDVFVAEPQPRTDRRALPLERPAPPAGGNERDTAKPSASPVARGDGWRGSQYRRPNGTRRAPAADGGAFYEDSLEDIGRG